MGIREEVYNIFDSEGRLLQVEYGLEAVNSSYPIVTLKGKDSIACVSKKLSHAQLSLEKHTSIFEVSEGLYINITGRDADIDYVVSKIRKLAASLQYELATPLTPDILARTIADKFQIWIQRSGIRAPAFAATICGFEARKPIISYTDISAVEYPCHGAAAGDQLVKMTKYLEKHCNLEGEGEVMEAAMGALLQSIGKDAEHTEIEAAVIRHDGITRLTDKQIADVLINIAEKN